MSENPLAEWTQVVIRELERFDSCMADITKIQATASKDIATLLERSKGQDEYKDIIQRLFGDMHIRVTDFQTRIDADVQGIKSQIDTNIQSTEGRIIDRIDKMEKDRIVPLEATQKKHIADMAGLKTRIAIYGAGALVLINVIVSVVKGKLFG